MDGSPLMDSEGNITSHLSGLFYRNISLMKEGMKLVYVFDGKAPDLKSKTHEKRRDVKEKAKEKYDKAKREGEEKDMLKYSRQLAKLTPKMVQESKELLTAMGIQCVQAPGEGEAQAAHMAKTNKVYAVGSQDYDALLFGSPRLVQNLTLSKKRKTNGGFKEVKQEIIEGERILNNLQLNEDQLICLGILVGTDYNPRGVEGIGQKTALDIVKRKKFPIKIFESVNNRIMSMAEEDRFEWEDIFELFHKPNVKKVDINFPKVNTEKIREILSNRDFSDKRIDSGLDKLRSAKEEQKQQTLF